LVGREVDADDLGLLVDDVVDEARVLVGEAVVVLPPDVRAEQVVEGGDGPALEWPRPSAIGARLTMESTMWMKAS
jgi:hypothetical protein